MIYGRTRSGSCVYLETEIELDQVPEMDRIVSQLPGVLPCDDRIVGSWTVHLNRFGELRIGNDMFITSEQPNPFREFAVLIFQHRRTRWRRPEVCPRHGSLLTCEGGEVVFQKVDGQAFLIAREGELDVRVLYRGVYRDMDTIRDLMLPALAKLDVAPPMERLIHVRDVQPDWTEVNSYADR